MRLQYVVVVTVDDILFTLAALWRQLGMDALAALPTNSANWTLLIVSYSERDDKNKNSLSPSLTGLLRLTVGAV
jgi:hypothetical protein